jgi:hypothetical protein
MASRWQLSRVQYGFALGILFAVSIHFPSPKALFGYAFAGLITALRFRALGWKVSRAFIPFAIGAAGTALILIVGPQSKPSVPIAIGWRVCALIVQAGMTLRAVLSYAAIDPILPKQRLARDFLAKALEVRKTLKGNRPLRETHRRESAKLTALLEKRKAYIAERGHEMSEELKTLIARFEAQKVIVEPLGVELRAATERLVARSEELKQAREAWKNRKNSKAG